MVSKVFLASVPASVGPGGEGTLRTYALSRSSPRFGRPQSTRLRYGMPPSPSGRYAWYVVGILTLASVSANVDAQILSLLVIPIKRDLRISDTQMSYLM